MHSDLNANMHRTCHNTLVSVSLDLAEDFDRAKWNALWFDLRDRIIFKHFVIFRVSFAVDLFESIGRSAT